MPPIYRCDLPLPNRSGHLAAGSVCLLMRKKHSTEPLDYKEWHELRSWSRQQGIDLPESAVEQLADYLELLKIWATRGALVGASEMPVIVRKHFADCLFAASLCPANGRAVDLGSGAGLPGLPIAIVRPGLSVDLVESRAKKVSFLTAAARTIGNAQVRSTRIEDLAPADYAVALARALAPLDRLLPLARGVLPVGGALLAMKSASFEDELAKVDLPAAHMELAATSRYRLPTGEDRVILRFRAL